LRAAIRGFFTRSEQNARDIETSSVGYPSARNPPFHRSSGTARAAQTTG
jgi:hypothetical protein